MEKKVKNVIKKQITGITLVFAVVFLVVGAVAGFIVYSSLNPEKETLIKLNGEAIINLNLGDEYNEEKCTFILDGVDYSNQVAITGKVDKTKPGTYYITYTLDKDGHNIELIRVINVIGGDSNGN